MIRPVYNSFGSDAIGWIYLSVSANIIMDRLKSFPLPADSCLYISVGDQYLQMAAMRRR